MSVRLNYYQVAPAAMASLFAVERYLNAQSQGLTKTLLELVKIRVSQLNGCAYCLDMHSKDSRALGESEQRLYTLSAWRVAPFYTPAERAALAWAEALTQLPQHENCAELLSELRGYLDDKAIVDLSLAVCSINTWNRFTHAFGADVGSYQPGQFQHLLSENQ
ncbi:carboxymuconolactone decarboxylase family protein [Dasania sp. GY-MA-18]|uniref:Carboxymuconolactone decarboxylase family protein n=1 Tax=Dasania phycosphaerae TaxID=2950436 RepID=A0A9J6RIZ5_9GAMM|nr:MULTISPECIES: carboxymuconolactone decarboxylase family protein [Dasania]MCR8922007.1 carboxymuconolactone decarboxylase family protein [Dasania sp. GY-MA-18]MCZ0864435.1 carboxymuconolactone decarboxylase family protein [Dasania phycosphaerae]MCZ0868163.1 carboxymuconolactone decarboxylase family protein [Dasania phycosphaerae]